jgi:hypothetical protein
MKIRNINLNSTAALVAAVVLLFGTSCTKDDYSGDPAGQPEVKRIKNSQTRNEVRAAAERIPAISWYNSTMDKIITFDPKNESKSFSFSDPNPGWNFSNADDVTWVPAQNGGGILFVGAGAFGGNAGGSGVVVAGNTSLNIASTFCFAASEEAIGLDIGGFGGPDFDGISGVIGFAGDLEALANGDFDSEADIYDYFEGIAYYVVYDNEASGNYDILNWFESLDEPADDLGGNGFAWVYGFSEEEWSIYFSSGGSLNVSGGSMSFEGEYFGLIFDLDEILNGEDPFDGFSFVEVSGFGQMGCN